MKYEIKTVSEKTLEGANEGRTVTDNWGYGNACENRFRMVYVENKGFYFRLESDEKNPVRNTAIDGGEVWKDSCLEFFGQFNPSVTTEFINFEFSAAGGMLAGLGVDRNDRKELTQMYSLLERRVETTDNGWSITVFIPNEAIFGVFGRLDFKRGYTFRGNFFKCCEEPGRTHFLSWAPISVPDDFHIPEAFGELVIV